MTAIPPDAWAAEVRKKEKPGKRAVVYTRRQAPVSPETGRMLGMANRGRGETGEVVAVGGLARQQAGVHARQSTAVIADDLVESGAGGRARRAPLLTVKAKVSHRHKHNLPGPRGGRANPKRRMR